MSQTPPPATAQPASGQQKPPKGLAIAGMVLGIVGLALLFCAPYVSLPCAVVGLILSVLGLKKAKQTGAGKGMAMTGIILCVIALVLSVLVLILAMVGIAIFSERIEYMELEQSLAVYRYLIA